MKTNTALKDRSLTSVIAALIVMAVHLVNASLFHLERPLLESAGWTALSVVVIAAAAAAYCSAGNAGRGLIALTIGLPAAITGIAIHWVHAYQMGVEASSITGLPMSVAGLLLTFTGLTLLVRLVHDWWRRLLLAPVAVVLGFFVVFPVTLAVMAANVAAIPCCDDTPADHGFAYEDVSFATDEGNTIAAWYIPSRNGATIVLVHGAGRNRCYKIDEAVMLARNDYGVLAIDVEGFGDSDGRANACGWGASSSIHAATAYLASRGDVDITRVGGLGLSMGGEVLLQAAAESTDLRAIVAEGATGRTARDFGEFSKTIYVFHTVVGTTMHLISGEETPAPLKTLVPRIAPRPVFLIGSQLDEERELMTMYQQLGGPSFQLWLAPESKHMSASKLHFEEFERRVVAFLDEALAPQPAGAEAR